MGSLKRRWWARKVKDTDCTLAQLSLAVEGAFAVFSLDGLLGGGRSVANLVSHVGRITLTCFIRVLDWKISRKSKVAHLRVHMLNFAMTKAPEIILEFVRIRVRFQQI